MSASVPSTDSESFYAFLGRTLDQGDRQTPPEALLRKWRAEREARESREDVEEALRAVAAGRTRPLEEFDEEFRRRNGLGPRRTL